MHIVFYRKYFIVTTRIYSVTAIQHLTTSLRKEVGIRKALFNQLQELRGNIRVICRVRPLCDIELDRKECEVCLCEHLKNGLYRRNVIMFVFSKAGGVLYG